MGSGVETESLYREHHSSVLGLCRFLLRDRTEAEDATQQVFLSAHRALLNGTTPREPHAWPAAIARNECLARRQARATVPCAPASEHADGTSEDAAVRASRAADVRSLWTEIARLPSSQREALLLREIRGLSYEQLAAELSLTDASVRSLLERARRSLRARLQDLAAAFGGSAWIEKIAQLFAGSSVPTAAAVASKVVLGTSAVVIAGAHAHALGHGAHHRHVHRHALVVRAFRPTPVSPVVAVRKGSPIADGGSDSGRRGDGDRTGSNDSGTDGGGDGGSSGSSDGGGGGGPDGGTSGR